MDIIKSVLDDFNTCSNLSGLAIDNNFNELISVGNVTPIKNYLSDLVDDLQKNKFEKKFICLGYDHKYSFLIAPISRFDNSKGYYIIYLNNITDECIEYIYNLLILINDDKFSSGKSNLKVSLHVQKGLEYCLKHYNEPITIDSVCNYLQINKSYFCKLFKKELDITFCNFLNNLRIEKSKYLLVNTNMSLLDIAISVGFNSQSYYTLMFKKFVKQTPIEYKNSRKFIKAI